MIAFLCFPIANNESHKETTKELFTTPAPLISKLYRISSQALMLFKLLIKLFNIDLTLNLEQKCFGLMTTIFPRFILSNHAFECVYYNNFFWFLDQFSMIALHQNM